MKLKFGNEKLLEIKELACVSHEKKLNNLEGNYCGFNSSRLIHDFTPDKKLTKWKKVVVSIYIKLPFKKVNLNPF